MADETNPRTGASKIKNTPRSYEEAPAGGKSTRGTETPIKASPAPKP